jgi:hypothetical protein
MVKKLKWTFDFKKFFTQRGERVGFGIAVVIMVLMVVINGLSMALGNGSAAANTRLLKDLNAQASEKITTSNPPSAMAALPPELCAARADAIDPDLFTCQRPFFGRETSDRKWRRPKVLAPVEFTAQFVRGGIESYVLVMGDDHKPKQIGVLAPHDAKQNLKAALRMQGIFAKYDAFNAAAAQFLGGSAGVAAGELGHGQSGQGPEAGQMAAGSGSHHRHPPATAGHGASHRRHHGGGDQSSSGESGAGESGTGESGTGATGGATGASSIAGSGAGETGRSGPVTAQTAAIGQPPGADVLNRTVLPREVDLKFISVADLMENPSAKRLAKTVIPMRMAIVSGSFPYRSQLEEYRRALHFDSIEAMLGDPDATLEFLGMLVQRRTVRPNGDPITEWADLDIETPIRQLKFASTGSQKENSEFLRYGIIVYPNRLVMPRPKLSRHERYPTERLTLVKKAIAEYKKSSEVVVVSASRKPSIFDKEVDVWSDAPIIGGEGANAQIASKVQPAPATGSASIPPGKSRGRRGRFSEADEAEAGNTTGAQQRLQTAARVPPKYCLMRFIDVTVEPGCTYEYRVKIQIANPGYNNPDRAATEALTRAPAVVADKWAVVTRDSERGKTPLLVAVPDDLEYYAIEEPVAGARPDHDRMAMEVHRWLDVVQVNPVDRASIIPVGGWSILPRILVRPGEYIGRTVEMPLPVWKPTMNGFVLATAPDDEERRGGTKRTVHHVGVPVDFSSDPLSEIGGGAILVDFDGGKRIDPNPASTPWEVLVYTADNKLIVRNSARDTGDPRRLARVNEWAQWLKAAANQGQHVKSGGHLSSQNDERGRRRGGEP